MNLEPKALRSIHGLVVIFSQAQCTEPSDLLPAFTTQCSPTNPGGDPQPASYHASLRPGWDSLPLPCTPLVFMMSWTVPFYQILYAPPGSNPYHKGVCFLVIAGAPMPTSVLQREQVPPQNGLGSREPGSAPHCVHLA